MKSEDAIVYIIVGIFSLFLTAWFLRLVHEIPKRNRYMLAQIKLLSKIAEKSGVPKDEIDGIQQEAQKT